MDCAKRLREQIRRSNQKIMALKKSEFESAKTPDGRVMEVLSEHMCQGWLEGSAP